MLSPSDLNYTTIKAPLQQKPPQKIHACRKFKNHAKFNLFKTHTNLGIFSGICMSFEQLMIFLTPHTKMPRQPPGHLYSISFFRSRHLFFVRK